MKMKKILLIGPKLGKTHGGMTSVIQGIVDDPTLLKNFVIDSYGSYIDGNIITRLLYTTFSYLLFSHKAKEYDLFHINVASNGSTYRKALYARKIKKNKKKIILHVHGGGYLNFYDSLSGYKKRAVDYLWNSSDKVIVLSNKWKEAFVSRFPLAKIDVIENGIDTDYYSGAKSNLRATKSNIVFLGRITKEKGIFDLLNAISKLVNKGISCHLYIAGSGDDRELYDELQKLNLDKNVTVLGWINETEKRELLKKCSIVVLPSYKEALPLCILEGMAAGKAIVATAVGSIPELIKTPKNGVLVTPQDVDELAGAIETVIHQIDNGIITGEDNVLFVEKRYSWHRMHKLIAKTYIEMLNGNQEL